MTALGRLWRNHRLALLAFLAAAALTLFFAVRLIVSTVYWMQPEQQDRAPEGWMTPGYVARSWDVPRDALRDALALPETAGHPPTLAEIARGRDQPLPEFLDEVAAALAGLAAER